MLSAAMNEVFSVIAAGASLVGAGVASYVALVARGLRAEMRATVAEQENRIMARVNGTYVKADLCEERHEGCRAELFAKLEAVQPKPNPVVFIENEAILDAIARKKLARRTT